MWGGGVFSPNHLHALSRATTPRDGASNRRFDFAYLEDAVTSSLRRHFPPCLPPAPGPPSPSYLSIIKVAIDPFASLPLSGCFTQSADLAAFAQSMASHSLFTVRAALLFHVIPPPPQAGLLLKFHPTRTQPTGCLLLRLAGKGCVFMTLPA